MTATRNVDASGDPDGYRVYIIEVAAKWIPDVAPQASPGQRCFYVGETGKSLSERFAEHRTGRVKPGRRQRRKKVWLTDKLRELKGGALDRSDVSLRRTMSDRYPEVATRTESEHLESRVIDDLRRDGHIVFPRKGGTVPF